MGLLCALEKKPDDRLRTGILDVKEREKHFERKKCKYFVYFVLMVC